MDDNYERQRTLHWRKVVEIEHESAGNSSKADTKSLDIRSAKMTRG